MLVLSRKKGEAIMIGEQIEVVVIGVEGDQVRLGIRAPHHVQLLRKELYSSIRDSNKEASNNELDPRKLSELFKKNEE